MKIKIKKLVPDAEIPVLGSPNSAGIDLCAIAETEIPPHSTVKIGTGLSFELPEGTFGAIFARSGLATKEGLRPANCVGVCDSDYRGEYIVALHNDSDKTRLVMPGNRIAQLIVMQYPIVTIEEVDELSDTERGDGGFGHTGR